MLTDGCACVCRQAAVRSSLQTEKETRAGLAAEHTELRQQVEQMREERCGWQERLKTSEERLRGLAAAELKAAAAEAAEQKERAAVAKLKETRSELKELRKQVSDLEAELAAQADARREEGTAAAERDECKAREGKVQPRSSTPHFPPRSPAPSFQRRSPAPCPPPQLRAELRAAELERDAYRKQLQEALASAAEPSAAARAEREAAALRKQLLELQADNVKLQAKLTGFEEREKQKDAVERQNARCALAAVLSLSPWGPDPNPAPASPYPLTLSFTLPAPHPHLRPRPRPRPRQV